MYKPHLKTREGVDRVTLDISDIIEDTLKQNNIEVPAEILENELFERLNEYIDKLAGSPDYSNYN